MTTKTPGQAAFEVAQERLSPQNRLTWETIKPRHREHWEAEGAAAAQAAYADRHTSCTAEIDRLLALLHETTVERDDAREELAALRERLGLDAP